MKANKGNIAFVTANMLSRHSADIVYIMEMCNALSKAGFNTTLCAPKPAKTKENLFDYYGVEFPFNLMEINLPKFLLNGTIPGRSFVFSIVASCKLGRIKNLGIYVREAWIFFLITVIFRRHCIFEAHQFRFGPLRTFIYHSLVKYGMQSGRGKVVCISESLMNQWKSCGLDESKMLVAHDAVNINKFNATVSKIAARQILGLDQKASIVAYTGSLIPGKGTEVLIKCSNRLPDILFLIVGGNNEEIAELRRLSQGDNVVFAGQVPPEEVPLYQAAADILALPNVRGSVIDDVTSPMKLFEYIASRRPIVASDMPSLLEILTDKQNALVSPAGDDYRLSENIKTLIENTSLAQELVGNAEKDLEKYTWDARIKSLSRHLDFIDTF